MDLIVVRGGLGGSDVFVWFDDIVPSVVGPLVFPSDCPGRLLAGCLVEYWNPDDRLLH